MASKAIATCDLCGRTIAITALGDVAEAYDWLRLQPARNVWFPGIGSHHMLDQNNNDFCSFTCLINYLLKWKESEQGKTILRREARIINVIT